MRSFARVAGIPEVCARILDGVAVPVVNSSHRVAQIGEVVMRSSVRVAGIPEVWARILHGVAVPVASSSRRTAEG
jgi:hypothetical protein